MSDVTPLIPSKSDIDELQKFAEVQFVTIKNLTEEITSLKNERDHLKQLLLASVSSGDNSNNIVITDEEAVCKLELSKLRDASVGRPLSFEEAKKFQIYTELLIKIQNKPRTIEVKAKHFKDDELLALLDNKK